MSEIVNDIDHVDHQDQVFNEKYEKLLKENLEQKNQINKMSKEKPKMDFTTNSMDFQIKVKIPKSKLRSLSLSPEKKLGSSD